MNNTHYNRKHQRQSKISNCPENNKKTQRHNDKMTHEQQQTKKKHKQRNPRKKNTHTNMSNITTYNNKKEKNTTNTSLYELT